MADSYDKRAREMRKQQRRREKTERRRRAADDGALAPSATAEDLAQGLFGLSAEELERQARNNLPRR
jgi:hypothetical protein